MIQKRTAMGRHALAAVAALVLTEPAAAQVVHEQTSWTNPRDKTEVPAHVFYNPALARADGTLPGVLYLAPRRGLQPPDIEYLKKIAGLGVLIVAPDWHAARLLPYWPVEHQYETELDLAMGLDALDAHPRARAKERRVLYGYSRGGYYAVRIAAGAVRPGDAARVGCIVTISGHFQDPNAPEPAQLYSYMPEVARLKQPILMLIGSEDPEIRRINNGRVFYALYEAGVDVEFIVLPMARRAYDIRAYIPGGTQTPEEALAAKVTRDKIKRFINRCLPY